MVSVSEASFLTPGPSLNMSSGPLALTVLCGIFAILVLIPMPWHLQSWNTATVLYMFWLSLAAGTMCINGIIWRNDAILRAEGFAMFCMFTTYSLHSVF